MTKRRKNNIIIASLCAVVVLMGIGYAAFSSQLNITGTSNITSNWDVRITNIESELHGATDISEPTYDNTNGLTASFYTGLQKPGDYAIYTITIENRGDIDARIEKINSYYEENEYVTFTLSGLSKGDVIEGRQSKELQVRVEFNSNITSIDSDIDVSLDVSIDVAQDSDNPLPTDDYYLTYDYATNGGTSGDDNNGFVSGETNLTGEAYREGYEFVGWNTDKNAHEGLEKVTIDKNTTVYAIFRKALNVTYNKVTGVEALEKERDSCFIYNNETNCNITLPNITPVKGYEAEGFSETDGGDVIGTSGNQIQISEDKVYYPKVKGETESPALVLNPNKQDSYTDGTSVTLSITDNGAGLKANQNVYYAWSTTNTESPAFTEYVTTTNIDGAESVEITIPESSTNSLTGTYYLWIKEGVEDTLGNTSAAKVSEGFNFDNTNPSLSVSTNKTTNSIQVVATANALSGIAKYEYSNNGGSSWVEGTNTYTFTGLTHNANYNIGVRVTSTTGKQTTSEITPVTTSVLNVPTFSESGSNPKTVTITYPEGTGLIYEYQKDSGSWTTATQSQQVDFTSSGTLVARVSDGTNVETATYSVRISQYLYYVKGYNLYRLNATSSGNGTSLNNANVGGVAANNSYLYYMNTGGDIFRLASSATGNGTKIYDELSSLTGYNVLDANEEYFYFKYGTDIYRFSATGSASSSNKGTKIYNELASLTGPSDIAVNENYFYYLIGGDIYRFSATGSASSSNKGTKIYGELATLNGSSAIAVNDNYFYYARSGSVYRVPVTGSGYTSSKQGTLVYNGSGNITSMAASNDYLFFVSNGIIYRVSSTATGISSGRATQVVSATVTDIAVN